MTRPLFHLGTLFFFSLLSVALCPAYAEDIYGDPIYHGEYPVAPDSHFTSVEKIDEPDLKHKVTIKIVAASGYEIVEMHVPEGWSGNANGIYSYTYEAGKGQYSGTFHGELVPVGEGGGQGEPTKYEFDVDVIGRSTFGVIPDQVIVPVPASTTKTETFTATENADWSWEHDIMPGSSSAPQSDSKTYDASCTVANPYTLLAVKHGDANTTFQAYYIPTGVQRLYVEDADDSSNNAETVWPLSTTMPIVAGSQHPDIETDILYVPYTEDENGQSTTSVNLKAFAYPASGFPPNKDESYYPDWTLLDANGDVVDKLDTACSDNDPYPKFDGEAMPSTPCPLPGPGTYTFAAECGNKMEVKVVVVRPELCLVRKPEYVPVIYGDTVPGIKSGGDLNFCGILYVYVKAKAEHAQEIKDGISIEVLDYEGPGDEDGNVSWLVDGPNSLPSGEEDDYFTCTDENTAFDQFLRVRLYAHEPGNYSARITLYGNTIDSGSFLFQAVSAKMFFAGVENHPAPIDSENGNGRSVIVPVSYSVSGEAVASRFRAKLLMFGKEPLGFIPIADYEPIVFKNSQGESFLNFTELDVSTYSIEPTVEGDGPASKDTSGSPLEFNFSSSYKKQIVQYNPDTGNYKIAIRWYPPDGVQMTKKAMVQPVRIICPEFGIVDIEETGQADGVDFVVFDDQAPNDHNDTAEPVGTCIINCTAKAFPKLTEDAREIVWDLLEWNLDDAGSVAPVYDDRNPENPHQQTIRYPGMPDHNDGFGPKSLTLGFKDRTEWVAAHPLVLRFNRDGHSAADQHCATLDNVEAGNPNWYVYWQQVADEFDFKPQTEMSYSEDETSNSGSWAEYSFLFIGNEWEDEITLYDTCKMGIVECITMIHHENGHRQSHQLPNQQGGWGTELNYDDDKDDDRDYVHDDWEQEGGYGYTEAFRMDVDDEDRLSAWHHGWGPEDGPPWPPLVNPDSYDQETGRGICARNEKEVEDEEDDIQKRDWSHE